MRPDTILQHLGEERKVLGAVVPPIFQNSLFVFPDVETFTGSHAHEPGEPYYYSRIQNPTVEIAEKKIAALEGADNCKVFGSGMGAVSAAILNSVHSGAHVVCVDTAYGPTRQFLVDYLPKMGVKTTLVTGLCADEVLGAIEPETSAVYLESPSSIIFRMQDFEAITKVCREKGITTITDNSYSGAIWQNPHRFGVDLVVHSATKYLAGHSDVVCGAVTGSAERIGSIAKNEVELLGGLLHPFPSWLLLRGLRTLKLRMNHAREVGNSMAHWLEGRDWVDHVYHVGLPDFQFAGLRDKYMTGSSSVLTFHPVGATEEWCGRFLNALKLFQRGVSWGGFESLAVALPMQPLDWEEARWVIRLYVGLEDLEDLQADLENAKNAANG